MQIISPVDSAYEAELLFKAGATELFCGYLPLEWIERYQILKGSHVQSQKSSELISVSLNKRNNLDGNITNRYELLEIIKVKERYGGKTFVTLNAFYYTSEEYGFLEKYVRELLNWGIDGFIVTDVSLIVFIHRRFPQCYLILSCCNQIANTYSINMFKDLGVRRITFPRHITLSEIEIICCSEVEMDYECFVLDSRCVYDDGNCRAMHNLGHFCMEQWDYEYYRADGKEYVDFEEIEKIRLNEMKFVQWSKPYLALNAKNNGWYAISCAACLVPFLIKHEKMKSLKVAGRGLDTKNKIQMVRTVKKMISLAHEDNAVQKEKEYISKLVGVPELCDLQYRCLVPSSRFTL